MKSKILILIGILVIATVVLAVLWPPASKVQADDAAIDVNIVYNPSGTHIHDGKLKVRFDIYLGEGSKSYQEYNIDVPDNPIPAYVYDKDGELIQELYDQWWETTPKHKELSPVLSYFVTIDDTVTKANLESYLSLVFDSKTINALDEYITLPDSMHYISPLMAVKPVISDIGDVIVTPNKIDEINDKFESFEIIRSGADKEFTEVIPQSITIGVTPDNFNASLGYQYTSINDEVDANADGTIDTVEIWANTNLSQSWAGTFFFVSGTTYEVRDSELLGDVTAGSKQTFSGLDIDVETGDEIGHHAKGGSGTLEYNTTSGGGLRYKYAEVIDPGDSGTFSYVASREVAIGGTGTEPGGEEEEEPDFFFTTV